MKKTILTTTIIAALTVMALAHAAYAVTWDLDLSDDNATITGATPAQGDLLIPETVATDSGDVTVVAIGDEAFADSAALTGVDVPYSVTNIGSRAFADCTALVFVAILNPDCTVADDAFNGCTAIEAAVVPSALEDSAQTLFPASPDCEIYRAERTDSGAPKAEMTSAALTGISPSSSADGKCTMTFDATLASGVAANIDPAAVRVIRTSSIAEIQTKTEDDATQDAISGDIMAEDKLEIVIRVQITPSADAEVDADDTETRSADKRYFKLSVED